MESSRAFVVRIVGVLVVAGAVAFAGACSLGPKQDDPLAGGGDSGLPQDASLGPDGGLDLDSSVVDTGKTSADAMGPFDDCDGGDGGDAEGGCVPADAGDADAPDAPADAPDAPSDAVDDGDAADVVVGG